MPIGPAARPMRCRVCPGGHRRSAGKPAEPAFTSGYRGFRCFRAVRNPGEKENLVWTVKRRKPPLPALTLGTRFPGGGEGETNTGNTGNTERGSNRLERWGKISGIWSSGKYRGNTGNTGGGGCALRARGQRKSRCPPQEKARWQQWPSRASAGPGQYPRGAEQS